MPDQQVAQSETLDQIAERITNDWLNDGSTGGDDLCDAILSALRNEREACAKLLDVRVAEISNYETRPYRVARRELEAAARSIREGR